MLIKKFLNKNCLKNKFRVSSNFLRKIIPRERASFPDIIVAINLSIISYGTVLYLYSISMHCTVCNLCLPHIGGKEGKLGISCLARNSPRIIDTLCHYYVQVLRILFT